MEAINSEQRRIQRFINLSKPGSAERGTLYIKKQGGRLYAYERLQEKGGHMRKVYLLLERRVFIYIELNFIVLAEAFDVIQNIADIIIGILIFEVVDNRHRIGINPNC